MAACVANYCGMLSHNPPPLRWGFGCLRFTWHRASRPCLGLSARGFARRCGCGSPPALGSALRLRARVEMNGQRPPLRSSPLVAFCRAARLCRALLRCAGTPQPPFPGPTWLCKQSNRGRGSESSAPSGAPPLLLLPEGGAGAGLAGVGPLFKYARPLWETRIVYNHAGRARQGSRRAAQPPLTVLPFRGFS